MQAKDVRIGDRLSHKTVGEIVVRGISPHCGDYKVDYARDGREGWVYLRNCEAVGHVQSTSFAGLFTDRFTVSREVEPPYDCSSPDCNYPSCGCQWSLVKN
jgi:hypothetical protein